MKKLSAFNCSAVAIIHRASDPRQIFIQQKDAGLPNIFGQDLTLCPFGGNWFGREAENDGVPKLTLIRELREELFAKVDGVDTRDVYLEAVLSVIFQNLLPWRAMVVETATEVLDRKEGNARKGFSTRVAYFTAGLDELDWKALCMLQEHYGRLSNEGNSRIVSLGEICESGLRMAYGHDQALRDFWLMYGLLDEVEGMFIYPNPPPVEVSWRDTYQEILSGISVEKTPFS